MERKGYQRFDDEKENFYKIDCTLFLISLIVVLSKAVIDYWSSSFTYLYDVSILNPFTIIGSVFTAVWLSIEWLLKPVVAGLMMSFITWQITYLDSEIPGVCPPTPYTYDKYYNDYRYRKYNHRFHLCYLFAIAVAPLTTLSLLITGYFS